MWDIFFHMGKSYVLGMIIFLISVRFMTASFGYRNKNTVKLRGRVIGKSKTQDYSRYSRLVPIVEYEYNGCINRSPGYCHGSFKERNEVEIYYNPQKFPDVVYIKGPVSFFELLFCAFGLFILCLSFQGLYDYQSVDFAKGFFADKLIKVLPVLIIAAVLLAVLIFNIDIYNATGLRTTRRKMKTEEDAIREMGNRYTIRKLEQNETAVLDTFLYEAIFIPEGVEAPPRDIINNPDLQVYVEDFGNKPGDKCFVAEADGKIVGAVWVRIMNDYGHVDDETPSFAISLLKDYRGLGIGTELMKKMLTELKESGYKKASLAVQKMNYAVGMYKKVGFEIIDENDEEYIMVCNL